jgi:hypothetical protein
MPVILERDEKGKMTKVDNSDKKGNNPNAGRPTVMTEQVLAKLELAFSIGCGDKEACVFAGISVDSLYRYQLINPDFSEEKELLKSKPILKARQEVVKGLEGNPELSLRFLEKKLKSEFGNEQTVNLDLHNVDEHLQKLNKLIDYAKESKQKEPEDTEEDDEDDGGQEELPVINS